MSLLNIRLQLKIKLKLCLFEHSSTKVGTQFRSKQEYAMDDQFPKDPVLRQQIAATWMQPNGFPLHLAQNWKPAGTLLQGPAGRAEMTRSATKRRDCYRVWRSIEGNSCAALTQIAKVRLTQE